MPDHTQRQDRYGLPLTTSSTLAAERFIEGIDLLLEQNFGPEEQFTQALEADAGFALAHGALAYMLHLRAQVAEARERAQQAQALAAGVSRRERQQIEAIALFVNGQGPRSYALIREHLAEYPRDMLMIRLAQRLFVLGCSDAGVASFPAALLALMQSVASAYGDDWAFLGQYAFAHHETGRLEEARQLAERSLALRPTNAVAAHSEAHVFFEIGDPSGGGDFLGTWLQGFDRRAPYRVHLSWHQALFELTRGHYQRALDLYEADIRPAVVANMITSLNDSAALLWRWSLYSGSTPPAPLEEVHDLAAPAAARPGPAFRDAHAAMAFAVAGDEVYMGHMIDRLRALVAQGDALAGEVTLPLVQGIHAFAHGAYGEAVRLMEPLFGAPCLDYCEHLEAWALMEALGFDGVGCNEHHTSPYGMMTSPNLMAAAASQRTSRMQLLIYGNLLPLHEPLRLAEELAMLDCLSNGRLIAGFARGIPREHRAYGVDMGESRARFEEAWEIIRLAWTEEIFSYTGQFWSYKDVAIWPRPVQQPHPPVWVPVTRSQETIAWAAQRNLPITPGAFSALDASRDMVRYYAQCLDQHGYAITPAHIKASAAVYVADSRQQSFKEAGPYQLYFRHTLLGHGVGDRARQQTSGYLTPGAADFIRPEHREAFVRSRDFRGT